MLEREGFQSKKRMGGVYAVFFNHPNVKRASRDEIMYLIKDVSNAATLSYCAAVSPTFKSFVKEMRSFALEGLLDRLESNRFKQ